MFMHFSYNYGFCHQDREYAVDKKIIETH
uniref:Uncharacterized protein n=1 Tax=Anguilla anguilla TaxID=7936 RepID=A0A0E9WCC0_ANGAN